MLNLVYNDRYLFITHWRFLLAFWHKNWNLLVWFVVISSRFILLNMYKQLFKWNIYCPQEGQPAAQNPSWQAVSFWSWNSSQGVKLVAQEDFGFASPEVTVPVPGFGCWGPWERWVFLHPWCEWSYICRGAKGSWCYQVDLEGATRRAQSWAAESGPPGEAVREKPPFPSSENITKKDFNLNLPCKNNALCAYPSSHLLWFP